METLPMVNDVAFDGGELIRRPQTIFAMTVSMPKDNC
jgi:hypothetical protein